MLNTQPAADWIYLMINFSLPLAIGMCLYVSVTSSSSSSPPSVLEEHLSSCQ